MRLANKREFIISKVDINDSKIKPKHLEKAFLRVVDQCNYLVFIVFSYRGSN